MTDDAPSKEAVAQQRRAAALGVSELQRVRAIADKWRDGMTAFIAVIATVTGVAGPLVAEQIVDPGLRTLMAVLLGLAVISLGAGVWALNSASFGNLGDPIQSSGDALRAWTRKEVRETVNAFKFAQVATLVGFLALFGAGACGLAGSGSGEASVTDKDGTEICGQATSNKEGDAVLIRGADGTVTTVKLTEIAALSLGDC